MVLIFESYTTEIQYIVIILLAIWIIYFMLSSKKTDKNKKNIEKSL